MKGRVYKRGKNWYYRFDTEVFSARVNPAFTA